MTQVKTRAFVLDSRATALGFAAVVLLAFLMPGRHSAVADARQSLSGSLADRLPATVAGDEPVSAPARATAPRTAPAVAAVRRTSASSVAAPPRAGTERVVTPRHGRVRRGRGGPPPQPSSGTIVNLPTGAVTAPAV